MYLDIRVRVHGCPRTQVCTQIRAVSGPFAAKPDGRQPCPLPCVLNHPLRSLSLPSATKSASWKARGCRFSRLGCQVVRECPLINSRHPSCTAPVPSAELLVPVSLFATRVSCLLQGPKRTPARSARGREVRAYVLCSSQSPVIDH